MRNPPLPPPHDPRFPAHSAPGPGPYQGRYGPTPYQNPGYPYGAPQPIAPAPLTLPGMGALPAGLGLVAILVGLFAMPWIGSASFLDIFSHTQLSNDYPFASSYVKFGAFVATAVLALSTIPWTLGAIRSPGAARWLANVRRPLTQRTFGWFRLVFVGRATVMLVIHVVGIFAVFDHHDNEIGPGPWVVLVGAIIGVIGAWRGPRPGPGMPPS